MKKGKLSTVSSVFVILCFVLFIGGLMGLTIMREEETFSYYENRNLAVMPEYTEESALDGSYFTAIDTYIREHAAGRTSMLKLNTYVDMNVLHRPVVNEVVIAGDVLLPFNEYEIVDRAELESQANAVSAVLKTRSESVESYGGKYYYVAIPCQYTCYADRYPWYMNDREEYTDASSEIFFAALEAAGVDYIDMLEYYEAAGRPEYFTSKVDHHFGIMGAYETYKSIIQRVEADTDFEPDFLAEDEFTLVRLENPYLGSRSRKLFGMWTSDERLDLLYPNTDVPFERWSNGVKMDSVVYGFPWGDTVTPLLYSTYMGGDSAHTLIDTNREELPSILIYGDSFTNAIESIAWYSFDEMHSLDLRYYTEMTIDRFIAEYQPEIVVCIKDYSVMLAGE